MVMLQMSNGSLKMTIDIFPQKALGVQKLFGNVSFDQNTVLEGVLSDDACSPNPCSNGAKCSVTWNDFVLVNSSQLQLAKNIAVIRTYYRCS